MKKLNILLAAVGMTLLVGCGGGGSGGSSSAQTPNDWTKIQKVEYTLNGADHPTCHNAFSKTGIGSRSTSMTCTWLCGEYEGARPVSVLLSFEKVGGIWEFEDDVVTTSELNRCHN